MEILFKKALFLLLSLFLLVASTIGATVAVRLLNHQAVWVGQPAMITVSGEGRVQYTPDLAIIRVAVITKGKDPETVQAEGNKSMQGVVAYLKESGIAAADLQTTGYNLYPEYDYSDWRADTSEIIGYTLRQNIVCKVRQDLDKAGVIIGGLTNAGANSIESIEFSLSDEQKSKLESEAKQKAVNDARARLEALRQGLRFRVLRLASVQDAQVWPVNAFRQYSFKESVGGAPAPIELGSDELVSNLTLTFEIK
jgi:uncharacterized protein YggE